MIDIDLPLWWGNYLLLNLLFSEITLRFVYDRIEVSGLNRFFVAYEGIKFWLYFKMIELLKSYVLKLFAAIL